MSKILGLASELYHATREINAAHQAKAHLLKQSQEFEINVLGVQHWTWEGRKIGSNKNN